MSLAILRIITADEEDFATNEHDQPVTTSSQQPMTPQQIIEVLTQLDPEDLLDVTEGCVQYLKLKADEDGAWQCPDGHMFRYAPPPAYPPWCATAGCLTPGKFVWVVKDDVTGRDWIEGPE